MTRIPANGYMPPGMAGKPEYFADGEQFVFNPERSKELLAEAGYEPGEYEITMIYSEETLDAAIQKQLVKGWEEGGFKVTGIPIPATESEYNIWLDPDNKINKTLNMRGVSWCSDWPSGSTMIPPLLKTDAVYNTAKFSEPSIDEEMDAIATMPLRSRLTRGAPWTRRSGPSTSRRSSPPSGTTSTPSASGSVPRQASPRSVRRTTRTSTSSPSEVLTSGFGSPRVVPLDSA